MDELAREFVETHDPEIVEELYKLARELEKMMKEVRERCSVWSCFSLWPKVALLWQKRTSIAGTLSDSQYSEVPSLFTGVQEEPLNTPKPGGFGLSL